MMNMLLKSDHVCVSVFVISSFSNYFVHSFYTHLSNFRSMTVVCMSAFLSVVMITPKVMKEFFIKYFV